MSSTIYALKSRSKLPKFTMTKSNQCCHSKKLENPRRATEQTPENPRSNLYRFWGKIELFRKKVAFFRKNF